MTEWHQFNPNEHRMSTAWMLGLTKKPFKPRAGTPSKAPAPSLYTKVASSPGGLIEYVASDGRKGALTGKGKPRTTGGHRKEDGKKPSSTASQKSKKSAVDVNAWTAGDTGWGDNAAKDQGNANDGDNAWASGGPAWGAPASNGSKKAESKKTDAPADNTWNAGDAANGWNTGVNDADETKDAGDVWGGGGGGDGGGNATWENANDSGNTNNTGNATTWDAGGGGDTWNTATANDTGNTNDWNAGDASKWNDNNNWNNASSGNDTSKPNDISSMPNPHDFTKDQDEKLWELKNKPGKVIPWIGISKQTGQDEQHCKDRWAQLKPDGWQPPAADKGQKGQGKGKKGKGGGKDNDNASNQGGQKNKEANSDSGGGDAAVGITEGGDGGDLWGEFGGFVGDDDNAGKKDSGKEFSTQGRCGNGNLEKNAISGGAGDNTWGSGGGAAGDNAWKSEGNSGGDWNTANQSNNSGGNDGTTKAVGWGTAKPASHAGSNPSAKNHSTKQSTHNDSPHGVDYKVSPDKHFSQNDLKIIAMIMREDSQGTWDRISDRFWDKTDRRIPPHVFEKKITGRVEREEKRKAKEKERESRREKEKEKQKAWEEEVKRQKEWDRKMEREKEEEMARRARKAHFGLYR